MQRQEQKGWPKSQDAEGKETSQGAAEQQAPQGAAEQQAPQGAAEQQSWSSRSLGSRFQHNVFCWLVRCKALFLARALLAAVVFYYTLMPQVRARCAAYVVRRFGPGGFGHNFLHTFRLYLSFGRILLERMSASVTGHLPLVESSHMRAALGEVLQRGKGCLVLSAHVGAWQMGLGALESLDAPVHVLLWRDAGDVDRHYFERGHGKKVEIIDASRPVEALVAVTLALRQGHVVVLMGDRLMDHTAVGAAEPSVETSFLGGNIRLPVKAYALASITGAPLFMIFTVRGKDAICPAIGGEILVPSGLKHRDVQLFAPYARQFAKGLEDFVARHPYQFFNFYNLWAEDNGQYEHSRKS